MRPEVWTRPARGSSSSSSSASTSQAFLWSRLCLLHGEIWSHDRPPAGRSTARHLLTVPGRMVSRSAAFRIPNQPIYQWRRRVTPGKSTTASCATTTMQPKVFNKWWCWGERERERERETYPELLLCKSPEAVAGGKLGSQRMHQPLHGIITII